MNVYVILHWLSNNNALLQATDISLLIIVTVEGIPHPIRFCICHERSLAFAS